MGTTAMTRRGQQRRNVCAELGITAIAAFSEPDTYDPRRKLTTPEKSLAPDPCPTNRL